jgi:hypothetical protein
MDGSRHAKQQTSRLLLCNSALKASENRLKFDWIAVVFIFYKAQTIINDHRSIINIFPVRSRWRVGAKCLFWGGVLLFYYFFFSLLKGNHNNNNNNTKERVTFSPLSFSSILRGSLLAKRLGSRLTIHHQLSHGGPNNNTATTQQQQQLAVLAK